MTDVPKVDFLVVGVQKAGTTALYQFLRSHPRLFLHRKAKELHFFDRDHLIDWASPDYSRYEAMFAGKQPGQYAGEATPAYAFWPRSPERIARYNPQMRLIMCLRDPADRAFSHWQMESQRGNEWLNLADAVRTGRHRTLINDKSLRRFSYVERGFYGEQIARLHDHFPKDQLLVTTHDAMRADLPAFLDMICRFLDIAPFADYPENRTIRPQQMSAPAGAPDPAEIEYLRTLYRDDIEKTEALTGLDLSAWRTGVSV
ncbi:sulfotransferase domain-containing protein [Parasphingopyxis algicola]|uniref:sulfotransferase family protein n=1 Tax=Parasphingopyxis algicola TaxID=2026624 RepID=UPI0015A12E0C|nr:sulfotransferase [Parasphingopyxis algicola]QLC24820.1 sulfotransferase domain-containing protein [Parasphingopyxis algicola]